MKEPINMQLQYCQRRKVVFLSLIIVFVIIFFTGCSEIKVINNRILVDLGQKLKTTPNSQSILDHIDDQMRVGTERVKLREFIDRLGSNEWKPYQTPGFYDDESTTCFLVIIEPVELIRWRVLCFDGEDKLIRAFYHLELLG